jgi:hypothetical protein
MKGMTRSAWYCEQGDAHALAFDDQGHVGARQVGAAAEVADAGLVEQAQHLGEGLRAVIAGVVVGQADGIEVALDEGQATRRGAEGVGLVGLGAAAGGDHAFEVADPDIGRLQDGCERRERVLAALDDLAGGIVEHDVADEHQRDRGRSPLSLRPRGRAGA